MYRILAAVIVSASSHTPPDICSGRRRPRNPSDCSRICSTRSAGVLDRGRRRGRRPDRPGGQTAPDQASGRRLRGDTSHEGGSQPRPGRESPVGATAPRGAIGVQGVEATTGFEPVNRGFADLRLNHFGTSPRVGCRRSLPMSGWPSRIRTSVHGSKVRCPTTRRRASGPQGKEWSGRRDSNPRPSPWQGDALPTEPLPPVIARSPE